jgi:hypothetical protein
MPSRTDGHEPRSTGRLLIGLCALALALQGIAMLVVDLPGCIEIGGAAPSSHVHVADDHPEGSQGLPAVPRRLVPSLLMRLLSSGSPDPSPSPVFRLIQPPRFA